MKKILRLLWYRNLGFDEQTVKNYAIFALAAGCIFVKNLVPFSRPALTEKISLPNEMKFAS